ncbi:MAG: pyruvate carboxyltransferase [Desulfobacteraceae bacterium]|nr:pyruvate carboxyltransferase [Desulfobacteraceae bacterium]
MAIIDSTLREGLQAVGISFSPAAKAAIAGELLAIGIEEIEIGIASRREEELASLVQAIRATPGPKGRLALWSRCREEDIAVAANLDIDVLSLSIPVTDRLLASKMGCSRSGALALAERSVRQARRSFAYVSVGLEDATRAEPEFLDQMIACIARAGAARVRLADTVGHGSPGSIGRLVARVRERSGLAVGFHGHNDFGMASANAVAALDAGAEWVDATVLGLGERAGNARLEEVAAYLALRQERGAYDLVRLRALCHRVARMAGREVAPQQPVIGEEIFACETGLHLVGLLEDPASYEPFAPATVGGRRRLYFGAKSGRRAVERALGAAGVSLSASGLEQVVRSLRHGAGLGRPPLPAADLPEFARRVTA